MTDSKKLGAVLVSDDVVDDKKIRKTLSLIDTLIEKKKESLSLMHDLRQSLLMKHELLNGRTRSTYKFSPQNIRDYNDYRVVVSRPVDKELVMHDLEYLFFRDVKGGKFPSILLFSRNKQFRESLADCYVSAYEYEDKGSVVRVTLCDLKDGKSNEKNNKKNSKGD